MAGGMSRPENLPQGQDISTSRRFLQYLASIAHLQEIHFLWRPFLPDPEDDMVLELAFTLPVADTSSPTIVGISEVAKPLALN